MANQNNQDAPEISLTDLVEQLRVWFKFLLSKWVIILFAGIFGGVLGLGYSFYRKSIYKAEINFALEDEKSSGGGLGAAMGLASQFGIDLGGSGVGGAFSGDNLLMLMKSRAMVETALLDTVLISGKVETIANYYILYNKLRESWKNKPKLKNIEFPLGLMRSKFSLQQDSILGVIYNDIIKTNLNVEKLDKKLSIITVRVNSEDEIFSKAFCEMIVKTVSTFYVDTKTKKSVQNVRILQKQTDSVRRELNLAINGVASSSDNNPNANPTLQILRAPSQRRQVDVQANQAILTELVKNLEISKVSLRRETPLIQIIDSPILPLEKDKLAKSKAIVVGGMLMGLLTVFVLVINRIIKSI